MNPDDMALYQKNHLTVVRQLLFKATSSQALDLTLCLNGIPVITAELKNPMTGQDVQNAMFQYRNDRDPNDLIFQFKKRALVHFAVDPDLVYMTTRLAGKSTYFLPFNKGDGTGRRQPACYRRQVQDLVPVGGGLAARQPARHSRPLHAPGSR